MNLFSCDPNQYKSPIPTYIKANKSVVTSSFPYLWKPNNLNLTETKQLEPSIKNSTEKNEESNGKLGVQTDFEDQSSLRTSDSMKSPINAFNEKIPTLCKPKAVKSFDILFEKSPIPLAVNQILKEEKQSNQRIGNSKNLNDLEFMKLFDTDQRVQEEETEETIQLKSSESIKTTPTKEKKSSETLEENKQKNNEIFTKSLNEKLSIQFPLISNEGNICDKSPSKKLFSILKKKESQEFSRILNIKKKKNSKIARKRYSTGESFLSFGTEENYEDILSDEDELTSTIPLESNPTSNCYQSEHVLDIPIEEMEFKTKVYDASPSEKNPKKDKKKEKYQKIVSSENSKVLRRSQRVIRPLSQFWLCPRYIKMESGQYEVFQDFSWVGSFESERSVRKRLFSWSKSPKQKEKTEFLNKSKPKNEIFSDSTKKKKTPKKDSNMKESLLCSETTPRRTLHKKMSVDLFLENNFNVNSTESNILKASKQNYEKIKRSKSLPVKEKYKKKTKKTMWKKKELKRLEEILGKMPPCNNYWTLIAQHVGGKTAIECEAKSSKKPSNVLDESLSVDYPKKVLFPRFIFSPNQKN